MSKEVEKKVEELEELWSFWIGSKMLIGKSLTRPVNFLGSVEEHKRLFLESAKEFYTNKEIENASKERES